MSKNQEVSAFGDDGAGDEMDIWVVTCPYQTVGIYQGSPNEDDFTIPQFRNSFFSGGVMVLSNLNTKELKNIYR